MSNEYDHSRLRYQLPSATKNIRPSISILLELLFFFFWAVQERVQRMIKDRAIMCCHKLGSEAGSGRLSPGKNIEKGRKDPDVDIVLEAALRWRTMRRIA